jgi:hypothetical protein
MLRTINRFRTKRVTTALVALLFMAVQLPISLLAAPSVFADTPMPQNTEQSLVEDTQSPVNSSLDWNNQNGAGNADPQCDEGQAGHWHWVLSPGGSSLTSGTLTVNYNTGVSDTVTGEVSGNGAMQFNTSEDAPAYVTSATVDYGYEPGNGQGNPVLTISDSGCDGLPNQHRTAVPVIFIDNTCNHDGSYTIPASPGVVYKVNGSIVTNGAYTVASPQTVTVDAYAQSGYVLDGTTTWTHEFTAPEDCTMNVTAAPVVFHSATCDKDGTYTIPKTKGVDYMVNGSIADSGKYTVDAPALVTVLAQAQEGYTLHGVSTWTHNFNEPEHCGGSGGGDNQVVVICERTSTIHNPYIRVNAQASAVDGNHMVNHTGPVFNTNMHDGDTWGDIVPPFGTNNGQNWNAEGQLLYHNNCNVPVVVSTDVCLNIPGVQKKVPEGMIVDENCICFTPGRGAETPPPAVPPSAPEVVSLIPAPPAAPLPAGGMGAGPEELVNTGTSVLPTLLAGTAILGAAVATGISSRRSVRATSVTKTTKTSR